jgi:hypothetical protein
MWSPSHEAHAARMRTEAEPPMRRSRKRQARDKYAAFRRRCPVAVDSFDIDAGPRYDLYGLFD